VKLQGGIVSHLMTDVDITCLASNLPEYLAADVSNLNLHESVHLSDLQLPEGVVPEGAEGEAAAAGAAAPAPAAEEKEQKEKKEKRDKD